MWHGKHAVADSETLASRAGAHRRHLVSARPPGLEAGGPCSPALLLSCSPALLLSGSPALLLSCSPLGSPALRLSCSPALLLSCSPLGLLVSASTAVSRALKPEGSPALQMRGGCDVDGRVKGPARRLRRVHARLRPLKWRGGREALSRLRGRAAHGTRTASARPACCACQGPIPPW